ncbi:MAG: hypothetical protein R3234_05745 [Thermoanaerobaculia bacterium]|nr:hypothetical protein [Thermoanaerobaculia bacterium]
MKLLHLTFQVQYTEPVEEILGEQGLEAWARTGRIAGRDGDGRHEGSQAFPGSLTVIQAQVPDGRVDQVLTALEEFRREKRAHHHLEALVLPVERKIGMTPLEGSGESSERDELDPGSGGGEPTPEEGS